MFRGTGFYEWHGTRYPVHGPTVLRQWPAEPMHYGPQRTWHELFLAYPPTAVDTLARRGYITADRPLWSIGDTRGVQHHLHDLSRLLANPATLADQIDRIDRSCEQLILESLMGASAAPLEDSADRVASVRRWIETHWRDDHDFDELARRHGLSPTHFRRLWQRSVGVPPHRFLIEGRLRHACRALVQTDTPIAQIARTHGFADPLYFLGDFVGSRARAPARIDGAIVPRSILRRSNQRFKYRGPQQAWDKRRCARETVRASGEAGGSFVQRRSVREAFP